MGLSQSSQGPTWTAAPKDGRPPIWRLGDGVELHVEHPMALGVDGHPILQGGCLPLGSFHHERLSEPRGGRDRQC